MFTPTCREEGYHFHWYTVLQSSLPGGQLNQETLRIVSPDRRLGWISPIFGHLSQSPLWVTPPASKSERRSRRRLRYRRLEKASQCYGVAASLLWDDLSHSGSHWVTLSQYWDGSVTLDSLWVTWLPRGDWDTDGYGAAASSGSLWVNLSHLYSLWALWVNVGSICFTEDTEMQWDTDGWKETSASQCSMRCCCLL